LARYIASSARRSASSGSTFVRAAVRDASAHVHRQPPPGGELGLGEPVDAADPRVPDNLDHQRRFRSTNRVIKTVARDAYGFRNPENQRLRTRTAITRLPRGHLNPLNFEEPT
jgi:hypothetical protein